VSVKKEAKGKGVKAMSDEALVMELRAQAESAGLTEWDAGMDYDGPLRLCWACCAIAGGT
jgi:hypothetical protein